MSYTKVNEMIINSPIKIPELQNSPMGDVCPTTRSFGVIDQDQSDNVLSQYLLLSDNTVAQDYKINKEKFPNFKIEFPITIVFLKIVLTRFYIF
jgi:hypothetical protein